MRSFYMKLLTVKQTDKRRVKYNLLGGSKNYSYQLQFDIVTIRNIQPWLFSVQLTYCDVATKTSGFVAPLNAPSSGLSYVSPS